jgi:hypothetical protein
VISTGPLIALARMDAGALCGARTKGKTENAISRLPFKATYAFRPGIIQPLNGITSKTRSSRILYKLTAPMLPLLHALFPDSISTTEQIGKAMLVAVRQGYTKRVLERVRTVEPFRNHSCLDNHGGIDGMIPYIRGQSAEEDPHIWGQIRDSSKRHGPA